MFDVKDYFDEENPSANAFMKRGAYYLKIHNPNNVSVTYEIYLGIRLDTKLIAENMRTLVLNDEFMSKHQAVVWQSDYLPKDSQPIDGALFEENHTNVYLQHLNYHGLFLAEEIIKKFIELYISGEKTL